MSFAPFYIHAGLLLWSKQWWTVQNSPDFIIVAPRIHRDGLICLRTHSVGKARTKAQGSWFVVYWLFCDTIYGGSLESLRQSSVHSQRSALLLGGWGSSFWQLPAAFLTEDCSWLQETALGKVMPPSQRVSHGERSADLRIQKSDSPLSIWDNSEEPGQLQSTARSGPRPQLQLYSGSASHAAQSWLPCRTVSLEYSPINPLHAVLQLEICFQGIPSKKPYGFMYIFPKYELGSSEAGQEMMFRTRECQQDLGFL